MSVEIIKKISESVRNELKNEATGHDWWHAKRVWQNAKMINKDESGNKLIIEVAALVHDLADRKLNNKSQSKGIKKVKTILLNCGCNINDVEAIIFVIKHVSFSSKQPNKKNLELMVVQDADRLDALGAIGIARTFAYGGRIGSLIHNPEVKSNLNLSKKEYKNHRGTSLNHFYEKLFTLKNLMNTKSGRKIAEERHRYIKEYVNRFLKEWTGKL